MEYINLTLEQALKMRELHDSALKIFRNNRSAYYDDTEPNHETICKQIHDLHQDMIRVVIPGYVLPDDYSLPEFRFFRPSNWAQYEEAKDIFSGRSKGSKKIDEIPTEDNVERLVKLVVEYSAENLKQKQEREEEEERKRKESGKRFCKRVSNLFSSKHRDSFPDFENGDGFSMSISGSDSFNILLGFHYPSHEMDIAKELLKRWKSYV